MKMTLAITPLESELEFVCKALIDFGYESNESRIGKIQTIEFKDLNLLIAFGGHGKVQFAVQTQFLLAHRPEVDQVVCIGAAGGISDLVSTFDVVVGEVTVEHDYTYRFIDKPAPQLKGNEKLLERLKKISLTEFKLHFSIIASGDEDVISQQRAEEIQSQTGAVAVAWEGAGGAKACSFLGVPFIELRAITDMASNSAPIDFRANLERSMKHIANVLIEFQSVQDDTRTS